jgi:predicted DNA-binding protein with PD1-like motif
MRVKPGRCFIGRFEAGTDLLDEITAFCVHEKIRSGVINVIGAVKSAKLGYYDQKAQKYCVCVDLSGKTLEIVSGMGNISLKSGEPFVHMHITFADHEGKCYGGHLMQGAEIFAAEYFIRELIGAPLKREFDRTTGLMLWQ